jgi:hypothetical protein
MVFKFDEDYRASDEYKAWVNAIKADYPNLPLYLVEQAIIAHKTDPQAYKKDKDAKKVFATAPKARVNEHPEIVNGAITIEDAPAIVEAIEDPPALEQQPSVLIEEVA